MNILEEIVEKRKEFIKSTGFEEGVSIPAAREVPLVPFGKKPSRAPLTAASKVPLEPLPEEDFFVICEFKRRSPSRGWIAEDMDPVEQASKYIGKGISHISVLTENSFFAGSLKDLIKIKKAYPNVAVLRKDFLISETDIEVSFRAGADAVLLIASILDARKLKILYEKAKKLGMEALVEVHAAGEFEKIKEFKPPLIGINSRNLKSFTVDKLHPLKVKEYLTWKASVVFESGIRSKEDAALVVSSGFEGLLIGESVMKNTKLIDEVSCLAGEVHGLKKRNFWQRLYERKKEGKPLVKICGITCKEDAELAADFGADILGFVFAPSVRRADSMLLKSLAGIGILKAGVVVSEPEKPEGLRAVKELMDEGLLDAVQFHGDESPDECFLTAYPYYKALRIRSTEDIELARQYRCPRILLDAYSPRLKGGTGKRIPEELIEAAGRKIPLWLAGGIGPGNVSGIIRRFLPELIDASSRLEEFPGRKNPELLKSFFKEVKNAGGS